MMKRTTICLITVFFMFISFKIQVYALNMEFSAPKEIDERNMEKTGLMAPNKNVEAIVRPNVEYRAQGLRNPFEQPSLGSESANADGSTKAEGEKIPQLTVQGVIWGGSLAQAIVNNKVVKVGDVLEGTEVIDINKEGVTVLSAGVEYKLTTLPAFNQVSLENK